MLGSRLGWTALGLLVAPWVVWCALAFVLGGAGPDSSPLLRVAAGLLVGVVFWQGPVVLRLGSLFVGCLWVTVWFLRLQPSLDRDWSEDQSRLATARFDGDLVHIGQLRTFRYRSVSDWDAAWVDATFDLGALTGVDLVVERFTQNPAFWARSQNEAVGHTLLSFGFQDGRRLAVSIEIRKEKGESFSALKGLFKQYELMYVLGDERDLLELRALHRGHDVYVHPLRAEPAAVRAMLTRLLQGTDALSRAPAFYNTLSASCTSRLADHLDEIADLPLDHRRYLPGYADALAFELGLIETDTDFAATRQRHLVTPALLQQRLKASGAARSP